MAGQLSIQSFYRREIPDSSSSDARRPAEPSSSPPPGDAFTKAEVDAVVHPDGLPPWRPSQAYQEVDIAAIRPGPGCVVITGRIVNFAKRPRSAQPGKPSSYLSLFVKDDTGVVSVKVWQAHVLFPVLIGQLVSVFTNHVSATDTTSHFRSIASYFIDIFPEKHSRSEYLIIHNSGINGGPCRTPVHYEEGKQLVGMMTISSFLDGGHEISEAKLLVCVKSIGSRKKFASKKVEGKISELAEIIVFDDTAEAALTFWDDAAASVSTWKPSETILLLTNPRCDPTRKAKLSVQATTFVEVDPAMYDAEWLRDYAKKLAKRDHPNPPFPDNAFDVKKALTSRKRPLFTLADAADSFRASKLSQAESFVGFFSLVIIEVNISRLHQKNMLCSAECCGFAVFANATSATCKHCQNDVSLRLNPKLIGTLVDETGSLASGGLIWSDDAWKQLLGHDPERLVTETLEGLRDLEQHMLFLRLSMLVGWSADVSKLAVCRILQT